MAKDEAKTPLDTEVQASGDEHKAKELWQRFWDKRPDGMVIDEGEKVCVCVGGQAGIGALWGCTGTSATKSGATA